MRKSHSKHKAQIKCSPPLGTFFPKLNGKAIRAAQVEKIHKSDITLTSKAPRYNKKLIALLNIALASELVSMLRDRCQHSILDVVEDTLEMSKNSLSYANQALAHTDKIAQRILELNGLPDFSPKALIKRTYIKYNMPTQYKASERVLSILTSNLANGRAMVETYRQMIACVINYDVTTSQLLEAILEDTEKRVAEESYHVIKLQEAVTIEGQCLIA